MIIEQAGLNNLIEAPDMLPERASFDDKHLLWRNEVIAAARNLGLIFTHGVAGKLINVYFKTVFVCGGHASHPSVSAHHPPIDEVLLKALRDNDVANLKKEWRKAIKKRWSKFGPEDYQAVIDSIKEAVGDEPMWTIEQYWQGFQGPALEQGN